MIVDLIELWGEDLQCIANKYFSAKWFLNTYLHLRKNTDHSYLLQIIPL